MQAGTQALKGGRVAVRKMVFLAMLATIAFVVMLVGRVPVVMFLKYDPKDVIIAFGGLLFGPMSAFIVSLTVSLVEMFTVSDTGPIGLMMNILSTCAFACTASFIYKRDRSMKGAVTGLVSGVILMVAVMLLWNYLIAPFYMHVSREEVAALLIPAFLPFNVIKGGLNATLTLLIYKPLVKALRGSGLLPAREGEQDAPRGASAGVMIFSAVIFASCVLVILVMRGVI
ncbi:MAG: ECF transporter S component [Oscillospiraceae bacterium]|jgi:riboflavin transporter FmnP|nr:ECF transporter S component [Oscillospiraceae bacterium]